MTTTSHLDIELPPDGNTAWGNDMRAFMNKMDDMGRCQNKTIPVGRDPETDTVFFDSWTAPKDITIFQISVDASAGAPSPSQLTGDIRVDGVEQAATFTLSNGAVKETTTYITPLNVDAGEEVGLVWKTVPGVPGRVGAVTIYWQPRAIT